VEKSIQAKFFGKVLRNYSWVEIKLPAGWRGGSLGMGWLALFSLVPYWDFIRFLHCCRRVFFGIFSGSVLASVGATVAFLFSDCCHGFGF